MVNKNKNKNKDKEKKLSKNFYLSEFNYFEPDSRLILILQYLRKKFKYPVLINKINGVGRTIEQHIELYKRLEDERKIKTISNKLGNKNLYEMIPFQSRHLASYNTPYLRAVDFSIKNGGVDFFSGKSIFDVIQDFVNSKLYKRLLRRKKFKNENDCFVGVGVGKTFIHLDIDRKKNTVWHYG
jgi:hypothetical protein